MTTAVVPLAQGVPLDLADSAFGFMTDSSPLLADAPALRARLRQDGYIYLPGVLDRNRVLDARLEILNRLDAEGLIDRDHPLSEGYLHPQKRSSFRPDLTADNAPLIDLLYSGAMIEIYELLFDEPVRHFDFTWLRAVSRGFGTPAHLDSVYMNRGTHELFTSWTPLGDIPLEQGGLAMMPGSQRIEKITQHYGQKDVDTFCSNTDSKPMATHGHLSKNPVRLRNTLNLPWVTSEQYRAGDVVIFSIWTIHCGLDNQTDRIRLSSDTRYQRASQPADERWISINGQKPVAHNQAGKRGRIC